MHVQCFFHANKQNSCNNFFYFFFSLLLLLLLIESSIFPCVLCKCTTKPYIRFAFDTIFHVFISARDQKQKQKQHVRLQSFDLEIAFAHNAMSSVMRLHSLFFLHIFIRFLLMCKNTIACSLCSIANKFVKN